MSDTISTFSICETLEEGNIKYFTIVPSSWTLKDNYRDDSVEKVFGLSGRDIMYYSDSKKPAVRNLLSRAKRNPCILPDDLLLNKWRCTIIRDDFIDYKSADDVAHLLEVATSESEAEPICAKSSREVSQSDLFMQILSAQNIDAYSSTTTPHRQSTRKLVKPNHKPQKQLKQEPQQQPHQQPQEVPVNHELLALNNAASIHLPLDQIEDYEIVGNEFNQSPQQLYDQQASTEQMIDNSMVIVPSTEINCVLALVQLQQGQIEQLLQSEEEIRKHVTDIKGQMNSIHELLKSLTESLNDNASTLNAKLDGIALFASTGGVHSSETPFPQPVSNEDQLKQLENDAQNLEFVQDVCNKFGTIFGKGVVGGGTIALQLIYKFFTKEFLTKCSWTGGTRTAGCAKIAFKNHPHVINLFFKTVQFCDPGYTYLNTVQFLQNRIKNAVQNQLSRNIRTSAERPSRKRKVDVVELVENVSVGDANREVKNKGVDDIRPNEDVEIKSPDYPFKYTF